MTEAELRTWLAEQLADACFLDVDEVDQHRPMAEHGLSSRDAVSIAGELEELLDTELPSTVLWDHPTIAGLAAALTRTEPSTTAGSRDRADEPDETAAAGESAAVAVVGIGCRLPGGVHGPEQFWSWLRDGRDGVSSVPDGRWSAAADIPRAGGFLHGIDEFDAEYFGISPAEARRMDPQQRILLEVTREAIDDAAISTDSLRGSDTGVFLGISGNEYAHRALADPDDVDAWTNTGGSLAVAANRLSYLFDFRGPSLAVDTACSSSLVAVHHAVRSLRHGESRTALACGANLLLGPAITAGFDRLGVCSPSGRCRPFSADADGIVRAEGAGTVVLKRLDDARADGDRVLAVIAGSAVNSDGRTNGLTAPSAEAQQAVLREAYTDAAIEPHTVDFVEAHGTGTLLGDPIEARALGAVLGGGRAQPLQIGSVKSNLGHLEAAAGIAGLIKSVLALWHRQLPATLHYTAPNPHIDFAGLGLEATSANLQLPSTGTVHAGVSGFGFGGTNAHVVLRRAAAESPEPCSPEDTAAPYRLLLGDRTFERLGAYGGTLAERLRCGDLDPSDLAHTAARRLSGPVRRAVVAEDTDGLIAGLRELSGDGQTTGGGTSVVAARRAQSEHAVWVFSGHGAQWAGMGSELLRTEPAFARMIDELEPLIAEECGFSLRAAISQHGEHTEMGTVQPMLFAMQLALAQLWRSYGQHPAAVIGHSMGEVAAAVVAGALSIPDGVRVIARRSALLDGVPGAMASIALSGGEVAALLRGEPEVGIAAMNAPGHTVISGASEPVQRVVEAVQSAGAQAKPVKVTAAAHSPMLEPLVPDLTASLAGLEPGVPRVPCYRTATEDPGADRPFDARYWAENFRSPVRFAAAVDAAARDGADVFLEVSPHPMLGDAVAEVLEAAGVAGGQVRCSMVRGEPPRARWHAELAALQLAGLGTREQPGTIADLPLRPWWRRSYWVAEAENTAGEHPLLGTHVRMPDGKTHVWQRRTLPGPERMPWSEGHLSAADYLELALTAGSNVFGVDELIVTGLRVLRDLPLADDAVLCATLTVHGGRADFTVTSRVGGAPARTHAHATVARGAAPAPQVEDAAEQLPATEPAPGFRFAPGVLARVLGQSTHLDIARVYGAPHSARQLAGDGTHALLLDAQESVLVELAGMQAGEREQPVSLPDKLYGIEWVPAAVPEPASLEGRIAVLDADEPLGAALRSAGASVTGSLEPLPDTVILRIPASGDGGGHGLAEGHEQVWRVVQTARALVEAGAERTRLVLYTERAGAVVAGDPVDPVPASVRACVRVLAHEHPELRAVWLDVDDEHALASELAAGCAEDEVAWRDGKRYVARLARTHLPVEKDRGSVVRHDGAYVVTGGLGGIGLVVARWLAESGAARIVLNGRSQPDREALAEIERLRCDGVEVAVVSGDIAEPGVAERLIAAAEAGDGTVRGVVHAAAVIDDRVTVRLDHALLARVWSSKVAGAWRLHRACAKLELDFWVGFSSMMGVLGFAGHAAYSPANACLDAIVAHRRALGLPATSVNWGVWTQVGVAREGSVMGDIGACDPTENIEALEAALAADAGIIGVTRPIEPQLGRLPDYVISAPFLERFAVRAADDTGWPGIETVRALPGEQARAILDARLLERVADILGCSAETFDTHSPLPSVGVDSLLAVRIRNSVQHDTGILLPPSLLLRGAALAEVQEWLAAEVLGHPADADKAAAPVLVPPRDAAERLIAVVCRGVLGEPVGVTQRWVDIAGEEELVEIAEQVTRRSDRVVTVAALLEHRTVERAAALVREPETPDQPVRVLRSGSGGAPLFLFHPGGGDTLVYRQLVDRLDPDLPVYGFDRLDQISAIPDRAAVYLPLLRAIQPSGPYRLAGWSFGGALAYEMATQLIEEGERVELLAMVDTILPLPVPEGLDEVDVLETRFSRFSEVLAANYGVEIDLPYRRMAQLSAHEQVDLLIEHIESIGMINADVAPAIMRHQRTSYLDVVALQQYRPRHIPAPVVFYSACDRQEDGIRDPLFDRHDAAKGWDDVRGDDLRIVRVPGHHLSVLDPPNVDEVAHHLRGLMAGEGASGRTTPGSMY